MEYKTCVGHSCEEEQKAVKYMDLEFGVEGRAGDIDLGVFRVTMKLGKWLRYGRLAKDLDIVNNYLWPSVLPCKCTQIGPYKSLFVYSASYSMHSLPFHTLRNRWR